MVRGFTLIYSFEIASIDESLFSRRLQHLLRAAAPGGRWFWEAKNTSELRSMRLQRYHFAPAGLAGHGRRDSKPQPGWSTRTLGKRRQRRVQNKMPSSDRLYAGTAVSCQTDPLLDNDRK